MFDSFEPYVFQISLAFVFGLCFGSFANVVIWRWTENWSIVWPPSHCPRCYSVIRWYDNIPVLSWVILRARCRVCGSPISWRYPIIELLMGLLFAAILSRYEVSFSTFELSYFVFALVIVSVIDFDRMLLPDLFTYSGMFLGLLGAALNPDRSLADSAFGLLIGGGVLWTIAFVYAKLRNEDGMGGGDIKLLAWIGAVLGWKSVIFVLLGSSVLGSVVGLLVAVQTKGGLKTKIPFGPYLAVCAVLYSLVGDELIDWYLRVFLIEPPVH